MSDEKHVQAQQEGGPWAKAWDEHAARMAAMTERLAQIEAQAFERARAAIDESARLQKETLGYWAEVGASYRAFGVEAARQGAAFWRGGA
jgi:hypothetical protein